MRQPFGINIPNGCAYARGALPAAAELARDWFTSHLPPGAASTVQR
jgi:hypothetical protein